MSGTTQYIANTGGAKLVRLISAEVGLYLGIALLVGGAWWLVRATGLRAGSDAGYWLGVIGGSLMILLFAYPLRKRLRFMSRWGAAKRWFVVHMVLGIGGPLVVLIHSTFRVGSLNAGVALYSMLIVAGSGVIGRFLYLRIHRGLHGKQENLAQLTQSLGLHHDDLRSALAFARHIEKDLRDFEHQSLRAGKGLSGHLGAFSVLPLRRAFLQQRCVVALKQALKERTDHHDVDAQAVLRDYSHLQQCIDEYLQAVQRVAQLQSATRLFSLWHVLHVPFVYLMVLCAVVHVVAVHAY